MRVLPVLAATLGLLCALPTEAAAQLVEPPAVTSLDIKNDPDPSANSADVILPLTLKEGAETTGAKTIRVVTSDKPRPWLLTAFTARLEDGALKIDVGFDKVHEPLAYGVSVRLDGTGTDGKPATQVLELSLVLPPAKLRPIPPLVLDVTWWPGIDVPWSFSLKETSHFTALHNLGVEQIDPAAMGDRHVGAKFGLAKGIPRLPAGGFQPVSLTGTGFSVGTTKGQIVIEADELEGPVTVAYEVRAKVLDWFIGVVFFVFGMIGWLVRVRLKNAEAKAELKAQLAPVLKRVARQMDTLPDTVIVTDLKRKKEEVDAALQGDDNAKLKAAVEALQTALQAALDKRKSLVTENLQKVAALQQVFSAKLELPVKGSLAQARAQLEAAERKLIADDLTGAATELSGVWTNVDSMGADVTTWLRDARLAVSAFLKAPPGKDGPVWPASVKADGKAQALGEDAKKRLGEIPDYDAASRPPSLYDYFRSIDEARKAVRRLSEIVRIAFVTESAEAIAALPDAGMSAEKVAEIEKAARLPEGLSASDPTVSMAKITAAVQSFFSLLEQDLTRKEAKDLAAAGDCFAAVAKEKALQKGKDDLHHIASEMARKRDSAIRKLPPEGAQVPAPEKTTFVLPAPVQLDPIVLAQAELRKIQKVRMVVSGLLLSVIAWVLYRDAWVGTPQDFLGVAVAAFFTDFTLDAAIDAVTKLKKPAAT